MDSWWRDVARHIEVIGKNEYDEKTLSQLQAPLAGAAGIAERLTAKDVRDFDDVKVLIDQLWADILAAMPISLLIKTIRTSCRKNA